MGAAGYDIVLYSLQGLNINSHNVRSVFDFPAWDQVVRCSVQPSARKAFNSSETNRGPSSVLSL